MLPQAGRRLPVIMDLGGPKFRIARVHGDEKERLMPGDAFLILKEGAKAPRGHLSVRLSHPALAALDQTRRARLNPRLLYCGGPTIIGAVQRLAQVRRTVADRAVVR